MKKQIKKNLERLYQINFDKIAQISFKDIIDELLSSNPEVYDFDIKAIRSMWRAEEMQRFNAAKESKELNESLRNAVANLELNHDSIVEGFVTDIRECISLLAETVKEEGVTFQTQVLFLMYSFHPYAFLGAFGTGDFPILEESKRFEYNYENSLNNDKCKIDYEALWSPRISLDEIMEEFEIDEDIWHSQLYQNLLNAYRFKTCLLLFEAFDQISIDEWAGIPLKLPSYLYESEQQGEYMNVYIYE